DVCPAVFRRLRRRFIRAAFGRSGCATMRFLLGSKPHAAFSKTFGLRSAERTRSADVSDSLGTAAVPGKSCGGSRTGRSAL
ncbi:hypothetical protein, partial [Priestia megaterium]|uniref:hypothetical protein n=1 Tax=Priestia megaterium TaxID=1404 RepID=UPI0015CF26E1